MTQHIRLVGDSTSLHEKGALGNDSADNSVALGAAYTAAYNSGYCQLYIPAGTYRAATDLPLPGATGNKPFPLRVRGCGSASIMRVANPFGDNYWAGDIASGSAIRDTSMTPGAQFSWSGAGQALDGFQIDGIMWIGGGVAGRSWLDMRSATSLPIRVFIHRTAVGNYDTGVWLGLGINVVLDESAIIGCNVGISDKGYQSNRITIRDSWIQQCGIGLDLGDSLYFSLEGNNVIQGCGIGVRIQPSMSEIEGKGPFAIHGVHFEPDAHWGGHDVLIDSTASNIREVSFANVRGSGSLEITGARSLYVSFGPGMNAREWLLLIPTFCIATVWDTDGIGPIVDYGLHTVLVQDAQTDHFVGWFDADLGVTGTTSVTAWASSKGSSLELVGSGGTAVSQVVWDGAKKAIRVTDGGALVNTADLFAFDGIRAQWFAAMYFRATVASLPGIWELCDDSYRGYILQFNQPGGVGTQFTARLQYYDGTSAIYAETGLLDMSAPITLAWGCAEDAIWISANGVQTAAEVVQTDGAARTYTRCGFKDQPAGTTIDVRKWMIDPRGPLQINKAGCQNWAANICRFMALLG